MSNGAAGIGQFVTVYPGIEGFPLLSDAGELGYISKDDQRALPETFPQRDAPGFAAAQPRFDADVARFRTELQRFLDMYRQRPELPLELGYVEPGSPSHSWRSASLVLYASTLAVVRRDEQRAYDQGLKDRYRTHANDDSWKRVRGIHRGLEDLYRHRGPDGDHRFFPVLYFHRGSAAATAPRTLTTVGEQAGEAPLPGEEDRLPAHRRGLRVLNLFWSSTVAEPDPSAWRLPFGAIDTHGVIFTLLRDSLYQRGALAPDLRVENRFSLD